MTFNKQLNLRHKLSATVAKLHRQSQTLIQCN